MGKKKYETHVEPFLQQIVSWRESGKTEKQIAEKLNIHYSTLQKYKIENIDLKGVLSTSKQKLIANLKKSLWEEAIGYDYEEVEQLIEEIPVLRKKTGKDDDNNEQFINKKKTKVRKIKKKARGNASLLIFALCNLCPEEFQRVDKEAVKELENKIDEKLRLDNSVFKKEFERLYPKTSGDKNE